MGQFCNAFLLQALIWAHKLSYKRNTHQTQNEGRFIFQITDETVIFFYLRFDALVRIMNIHVSLNLSKSSEMILRYKFYDSAYFKSITPKPIFLRGKQPARCHRVLIANFLANQPRYTPEKCLLTKFDENLSTFWAFAWRHTDNIPKIIGGGGAKRASKRASASKSQRLFVLITKMSLYYEYVRKGVK